MKLFTIASILGIASLASADVFLYETFSDGQGWKDRWTLSSKRENLGALEVSPGKWFVDEKENAGLRTTEDSHFYAASTKMKPFNNKGKTLVVQLDVKNEQNIDCGGSYVKLFSKDFDPKEFDGETSYNIMFGPDICGSKAVVHAIFNYNGVNHELTKNIMAPQDTLTHTYTLTVKPDQTYSILVDGEEKAAGNLIDDWNFLEPKKIKDPNAEKPSDWVDNETIEDPEDTMPEGWDDIPEFMPDPEAVKPEDWDDDMDGDWEAPAVPNPDFKGKWVPQQIPNPEYKGEWVHPEIDNPDYKDDKTIYIHDLANLGIDLWQVKAGSIFDNILVTDDEKEAEKVRKASLERAEKESDARAEYEKIQAAEAEESKAEEKEKPSEDIVEEVVEDEEESKVPIKDEL